MFFVQHGHFVEKEFLDRSISGRKIELGEIVDPSLQIEGTVTEDVPEPSSVVGVEENDDDHDNHNEEPTLPRRSTRVRNTIEFYGQLVNAVMLDEHDEPANYKEAMEGPESEKWLEAMKSEIGSMYDNKVWTLVDIPKDRKAIDNK